MRTLIFGAATLLVLGVAAYPLSLCDYTAPETSVLDAGLSFVYHYLEDPARPGYEINSGSLSFTYTQIYSSPERGFSLNGDGAFGLQNFALVDSLVEGTGTYRHYLAADEPLFLFGGFEGRWRGGYVSPWLQVTLGLGYGRFNDVTPLAKAMLIEEDLLRMGAIPASLSEDALLAVAQEIGRRVEYEKVEDLVAKVVEIIQTDTGAKLDARAVLDVEDRITETGRERFCGGAVQAGVGYEVLDPEGGERDVVLNASADWAIAPEPRSQLLIRADLSAPLPWKAAYRASLTASYDYEINGGTTFSADYSGEWLKPADLPGIEDRHLATFQLGLNLGGWDVGLQVTFSKGPGDPAWTQEFTISAALDLF